MSSLSAVERDRSWPSLPYAGWKETCETLHLWTQIAGKVNLRQKPMVNHWWQVVLHVSPRGLTTGCIPHGNRAFEMEFDFREHRLRIETAGGASRALELRPQTVASFHGEVMDALRGLGLPVKISTIPQEIPEAIPFEEDTVHGAYDRESVQRFQRILLQSNRLLWKFRGEFTGKASPPHFFWGSFDLCHTRFSGRPAPPHPPSPLLADSVLQEAYAEEEYTVGFWPGSPAVDASFYAYIYPEPRGFREAAVNPRQAHYSPDLGEFLLPYEAVRRAPDPDEAFLDFARSTYRAAADLARWNRDTLERPISRVSRTRARA